MNWGYWDALSLRDVRGMQVDKPFLYCPLYDESHSLNMLQSKNIEFFLKTAEALEENIWPL